MATLIEEVLAAWRDGERVLADLPEVHPDHESVALAVAELRALYAQLTDISSQSRRRLRATNAALERTAALLERVRASHERRDRSGPPADAGRLEA
jgi:hypothetical protein